MKSIGILSPGEMGTAVAKRLAAAGQRVLTCVVDRSPGTRQRATAAGLELLPSLDALVRETDLVVSLVTPFGARHVADGVAQAMDRTGSHPTFVEGNSISPSTAKDIAATIEHAGGEFVDGGIIGGAGNLGKATFYFSGQGAPAVAERIGRAVPSAVVGPKAGQASGLKILNAGLSKGLTALGVELLVCAQELELLPEIMARYRAARGEVTDFWAHVLPDLPGKAARRSEEMQELTGLMEELGLSAYLSRASEQVLAMVAERYTGGGAREWARLVQALEASPTH